MRSLGPIETHRKLPPSSRAALRRPTRRAQACAGLEPSTCSMAGNPLPTNLGGVAVWDEAAEGPRDRRIDEATVDGEGDDPADVREIFIVMPGIGVCAMG